jgi:uncharacterized OsmC-like protein
VLVIKRVRVRYRLRLDPAKRETAERVHSVHMEACPVARTLRGCMEITTALEMLDQ